MYSVEKTKSVDILKNFDYFLFITFISLNTMGIVALISVSSSVSNGKMLVIKQLVGALIGFVGFVILSLIDYKALTILSYLAYGFTTLLLLLVLVIGEGKEEYGTQGWFVLGPVSLQPSELGKVTLVMLISIYFANIKEQTGKYNIPLIIIACAIPIALILKQPDFGTAVVYVFIIVIMIFVSGIKYRYIFITAVVFMGSIPILWSKLKSYQKDRILSFLRPGEDPMGRDFQVLTAKRAIGSGQLWGKGLFEGKAYKVIPEVQSDLIFSVIGEELGFVGSAFVILLFMVLILRCLYIAYNSRDYYGSFLVIGITSMIVFHFFENIGMSIGLMPVTDIPLPFISSGGTSIITNYVALGVIMSVSIRRRHSMFDTHT